MKRLARVLLPILLLTGTLAAAPKPGMRLRVSTHSGPSPLLLELDASIAGMNIQEIAACLFTVERNYTTPGGQKLISKVEIPCVDAAPDAAIPVSFKKQVTLEEPGLYSYRLVLDKKDGKRMASTSQEVKVYRGGTEIGVTAGDTLPRH